MKSLAVSVLLFLACGLASAATCTTGQLPYRYGWNGFFGEGSTPEGACGSLGASTGATITYAGNKCTVQNDGSVLTVTQLCEVETTPTDPTTPADPNALNLALYGITPTTVLHVYSWGFASVLGMFLLGWLLSLVIGLIRKL